MRRISAICAAPSVSGGSVHAESPEWTPGLLDVLEDAAEEQLGAVEDRVDVDLDRAFEEAVDQDRLVRARPSTASCDVALQAGVVVDDLHRATAEHVDGRTSTG